MAERNISKIEEVMRFPPAAITRHLLKKEAAKHNIVTKIKCHRTDCSVFSLNFTIYFFLIIFGEFQKSSQNPPSDMKYFSVNVLAIPARG